MAEQQLSHADIDALASKMDQLGASLTASERAVLLGVFARAKASLAEDFATAAPGAPSASPKIVVDMPPVGAAPPLSEGFRDVFDPGAGAGFAGDDTAGFAMREPDSQVIVGVQIKF